jgi:hypothetical protein
MSHVWERNRLTGSAFAEDDYHDNDHNDKFATSFAHKTTRCRVCIYVSILQDIQINPDNRVRANLCNLGFSSKTKQISPENHVGYILIVKLPILCIIQNLPITILRLPWSANLFNSWAAISFSNRIRLIVWKWYEYISSIQSFAAGVDLGLAQFRFLSSNTISAMHFPSVFPSVDLNRFVMSYPFRSDGPQYEGFYSVLRSYSIARKIVRWKTPEGAVINKRKSWQRSLYSDCYGLDSGEFGVRILERVAFFSLCRGHGFEANSASYSMGTGGFFLGF